MFKMFEGVGFYTGDVGQTFNIKLTIIFIVSCLIVLPLIKDIFCSVIKYISNTSFWKYKIARNAKRLYYLLCCSKVTIRFEIHKHCSVIKVSSNMDEVEIIDAVYKELD